MASVLRNLNFVHMRSVVLACFKFWFGLSNPKEQPCCLIKKVVPLYFGFCSLENEQNFSSNHNTEKLMNVPRNKQSYTIHVTGNKNAKHLLSGPRIEPGSLAWQSDTLPRHYKSRLEPQGSTSVYYT